MRKGLLAAVAAIGLGAFGMGVANAATPSLYSYDFNFGAVCPAAGYFVKTATPAVGAGVITGANITFWDVPAHRSSAKLSAVNGSVNTNMASVATGEASAASNFGFPGFGQGVGTYPPIGVPLSSATTLVLTEICESGDLVSGTAEIHYYQ